MAKLSRSSFAMVGARGDTIGIHASDMLRLVEDDTAAPLQFVAATLNSGDLRKQIIAQ